MNRLPDLHLITRNGTLAVGYAVIAWASLRLFATLNASASPVWPPTGLAIAILLLWGPQLWPGVYVGAFAANLLTTGNPVTSLAIAAGNTLEALTCWFLVSRFANGTHAFERPRNLGIFMVAGVAASIVSATIGVTTLAVAGLAQWSQYLQVWTTWWFGDASGALIVAPLIISFLHPPKLAPKGSLPELSLMILSTIVVSGFVFAPTVFSVIPFISLGFTVVPIIVWAGLRFGTRGATGTTLLFSSIAVWGTLDGLGPYGKGNTALLSLQFSMTVLATMGLAVGAVVYERLDARAAEKRIETLIETAPDAMIIADEEGKVMQVNVQTETLFGYNRQELLNLKVEDLIPVRYRGTHVTHRSKFYTAPRRRGMGVGMELHGLRKDGTEFPVEISLSPLQTDSGLMVSASVRDITERRRAQEERTRLTTIIESSSDAIIRETLDGTIVSWNKGAERMFGYTASEAEGQKEGILMPSDTGKSEFAEKLKQQGRILPYETRLVRKDGVVIDALLTVSPIRDPNGRTVGASILIQDLTNKRIRETPNKAR